MRAWGIVVRNRFASWPRHELRTGMQRFLPVAAGLCVSLVASALLTQFASTVGIGFGVRLGIGLSTCLGIIWGSSLSRSERPMSLAGHVSSLAALLVLWPVWSSVQLEALSWFSPQWWNLPFAQELCGIVFALLTWTIPSAIITQCLTLVAMPARVTEVSVDQDVPHSNVLPVVWGCATGLFLSGYLFAPLWGVLWPACGALVFFAVGQLVVGSGGLPKVITQCPTQVSQPVSVATVGMWLIAGFQLHAGFALMSETTVVTWSLVQLSLALILGGWCVGYAWRGSHTSTASNGVAWPSLASEQSWLAITAVQLAVASVLIPVSLWLASRIVSPLLLDFVRVGVLGLLTAPVGIWLGRQARIHSAVGVQTFSVMAGATLGVALLPIWSDPLSRIWCLAGVCLAWCIAIEWRQRVAWNSWSRGTLAGLTAGLAMLLTLTPTTWPTQRAIELLFSTPAVVGARSDWPTALLPYLDDSRMVSKVSGSEGSWTLWRTRGADLQVRCQGIPRGAITTRPDWSPQYAPDVASTVWPLVLVDQPARVLVLGAGSSASLQAALAFPLEEVVCCEPDDALLTLLRDEVAMQGGFDPFADHRCRRIRQPETWLAFPADEQFDVIVSTPAPMLLPDGAAAMTVEFYRRAAQRLSANGVFCQRVTSVDFGPRPLLSAAVSCQQAFAATACLEVGTGEYLLLGAHDASALVRPDLSRRLEMTHVAHVLSRCNWDWSQPLNLPAYDGDALAEAAIEVHAAPQTTSDAWLPYFTPRELWRWAPKLQETAQILTKTRTSAAVFPLPAEGEPPRSLAAQSRKSRYLEWMGSSADDPELLRRLTETTAQRQLVAQFPDSHWWEYRKELRTQLQDHPRTAIRTVSHSTAGSGKSWHPEDRRRKEYFQVLGAALKAEKPTSAELAPVEELLEPYDPLLSYFAHQELAELYAKSGTDPANESSHRLHVIYYAPAGETSVRNVILAIDHLVESPAATLNETERFEQLNGLLQTLRTRWEARNLRPAKSTHVTQQEIERSLMSVERAIDAMEPLARVAGFTDDDWAARKQVLERILVRPFRGYRDQLVAHNRESQRKTRELLQRATNVADEDEAPQQQPRVLATGQ